MFMDISSEIVHALLPLYMVGVLGASVFMVGIIEGIAEATASVIKVFSGAISDRFGKRKILAVIGYSLGALAKPVFPMAVALEWFVGARFMDRVGKGIRGAPRDALVADVTPAEMRGAAYGLRQALDTIGSFTGPLLAIGLMWWTASNYQLVFWIGVLPAFVSVVILVFMVKETDAPKPKEPRRFPLNKADLLRLDRHYWFVVAIGMFFTLARFSEAFLILRAEPAGLPQMWAPAMLAVMALAYAVSAYPAGALSDRMRRTDVLLIGLALLVAADLFLAFATGWVGVGVGAALWGLHMGFSQGLLNALIADRTPGDLRGTGFGLFNLMTGLALLLASVIAGLLWDRLGYQWTFICGAGFALIAGMGLLAMRRSDGAMQAVQ